MRIEGIFDDGHNMLAIRKHLPTIALGCDKFALKIKRWPEFKDAW